MSRDATASQPFPYYPALDKMTRVVASPGRCGIEIQKSQSVRNFKLFELHMGNQQRKISFWIFQLIILLAAKSAKFPGFVESVPINYDSAHLERVPRASGNLDTSLERLKAVARVTNGIYLAQELINGTDHQEEITSELLRMGSVTPTQISNMDAEKLKTAIQSIQNVQLVADDQTTKAELFVKTVVEINDFMKNVNDITVWPGKADFETAVNGLKSQSDAVKATLDFKEKASEFENVMKQLATNVASYPFDFLKNHTNDMLSYLEKMKPDDVKFSKTGTALEVFAQPMKTAKFLEKLSGANFNGDGPKNVKKNFGNVVALGKNVEPHSSDFREIQVTLKTRKTLGISRKLDYTAGLTGGFKDLESLSSDVNGPWMSLVINASGSLEKSVEDLKSLISPLKTCETKLGSSNREQLAAIGVISERSKILGDLHDKSTDTIAALDAAFGCDDSATKPGIKDVLTMIPLVQQLDSELSTLKSQIIAALEEIEVKKIKDALSELKKEFDDNPSLPPDQMWLKVKEFNGTKLRDPLKDLHSNKLGLEVNYQQLKTAATNLHGNFSNVTDFYTDSNMRTSMGTFGKAKVAKNLELVDMTLHAIESIRKDSTNAAVYNDAVSAVKKVTDTTTQLTAVTTAMNNLKDKTSSESEHLKLLKEPKKTALNIGKSVQSVVLMNEVFNKMTDIQKVIDNIELVTPELTNAPGLFSEDSRQLMSLSGLKIKFETLKTDLNQWETNVASAEVKELKDASSIYTPAQIVNGIDQDLAPMVSALENLIAIIPNSPNLSKLTALKQSLDTLTMYDLKFSNFKVDKTEADASFDNLQEFFTDFASATNPIPSTARPIVTSQRPFTGSTAGGGTAASGEQNKKLTALEWMAENVGWFVLSAILILLLLAGGGAFYFFRRNREAIIAKFKKENKELADKLKKQDEEIKAIKKRADNRVPDLVAEAKPLLASTDPTKKAPRKAKPAPKAPVEPVVEKEKSLMLAKTQDTSQRKSLSLPAIALDRINGFVIKVWEQICGNETHQETLNRQRRHDKMSTEKAEKERLDLFFYLYKSMFAEIMKEANHWDSNMIKFAYVDQNIAMSRYRMGLTENTRVKVTGFASDYLHANIVSIHPSPLVVIAMQAPLGAQGEAEKTPPKVCTCERTWEMFRQQNVTNMVMLTKIDEPNDPPRDMSPERKCAQYYPNDVGGKLQFGNVVVTCTHREEVQGGEVIVRKLHAKYIRENSGRVFTHYQYIGWPDHGVPTSMGALHWLLRQVDHCEHAIVVHCSAGVGRTGVFCFLLLCAQKINAGNYNMFLLLAELRQCRNQLVRSAEQLAFCIQAIVPYMLNDRALSPLAQEKFNDLADCFGMLQANTEPKALEVIIGDGKVKPATKPTKSAVEKPKSKSKSKEKTVSIDESQQQPAPSHTENAQPEQMASAREPSVRQTSVEQKPLTEEEKRIIKEDDTFRDTREIGA